MQLGEIPFVSTYLPPFDTTFRPIVVLRYAVYFVLFLNAGSLPFVWHFLVFWRGVLFTLEYQLLFLRSYFVSEKKARIASIKWAESRCPAVGASPFETYIPYNRRATIDDIDMFGFHLSNSSYAKTFDAARVRAGLKAFPTLIRAGGYVPLAATHYHFIREIPAFARYEVRVMIGAWDNKWMYLVARFVTRPGCRSPGSTDTFVDADASSRSVDVMQTIAAVLRGDSDKSGDERQSTVVEPDGAILRCVAVAKVCFKLGRITVPPAVVLASEGFTKPFGDGGEAVAPSQSYSHRNPPPNWIKSRLMWLSPDGNMSTFRAFLRGGWRDVPEGERWWEDALGGSIEARRRANMDMFESLKLGLEGAQTLCY